MLAACVDVIEEIKYVPLSQELVHHLCATNNATCKREYMMWRLEDDYRRRATCFPELSDHTDSERTSEQKLETSRLRIMKVEAHVRCKISRD